MAESNTGTYVAIGVGVVVIGGILYVASRPTQPTQVSQPQPTNQQRDAIESITAGLFRGLADVITRSSSNEGMSEVPPRPQNNPGQNSGGPTYPGNPGWEFQGGNNINNWQPWRG